MNTVDASHSSYHRNNSATFLAFKKYLRDKFNSVTCIGGSLQTAASPSTVLRSERALTHSFWCALY